MKSSPSLYLSRFLTGAHPEPFPHALSALFARLYTLCARCTAQPTSWCTLVPTVEACARAVPPQPHVESVNKRAASSRGGHTHAHIGIGAARRARERERERERERARERERERYAPVKATERSSNFPASALLGIYYLHSYRECPSRERGARAPWDRFT